ncbi:hypothetical protein HYE82_13565, partial [Streptomyces sp. BR123]|nr:hypothetical protein [Streptomyces sp. BR123]
MTHDRKRLSSWLLAGLVLVTVITLYQTQRTGAGQPVADPCAQSSPGCPGPGTSPPPTPAPSPDPSTGGAAGSTSAPPSATP